MKFCLIIRKPEVIKVSQTQAGWANAGRNMANTEQKFTQAGPQEFIQDWLKTMETEVGNLVKTKESRSQWSAALCQEAETGSLCMRCLER